MGAAPVQSSGGSAAGLARQQELALEQARARAEALRRAAILQAAAAAAAQRKADDARRAADDNRRHLADLNNRLANGAPGGHATGLLREIGRLTAAQGALDTAARTTASDARRLQGDALKAQDGVLQQEQATNRMARSAGKPLPYGEVEGLGSASDARRLSLTDQQRAFGAPVQVGQPPDTFATAAPDGRLAQDAGTALQAAGAPGADGKLDPAALASDIDRNVPAASKGAVLSAQADLDQQVALARGRAKPGPADNGLSPADAAERTTRDAYWSQHAYYVDPTTQTAYRATYQKASGELTLTRAGSDAVDDQGRNAKSVARTVIRPDGSTRTDVATLVRGQGPSGPTQESTTWSTEADATGRQTALYRTSTKQELRSDTGLTRTTLRTDFQPGVQDGQPIVKSQHLRVEMSAGNLPPENAPPGPAVLDGTTTYDAKGVKLSESSTYTQGSPGFDVDRAHQFQRDAGADLADGTQGHFKPKDARVQGPSPFTPGQRAVTISETSNFNSGGQAVGRTRTTEQLTTEPLGKDDKNHNGIRLGAARQSTAWGLANVDNVAADNIQSDGSGVAAGTERSAYDAAPPLQDNAPPKEVAQASDAYNYDPDGSSKNHRALLERSSSFQTTAYRPDGSVDPSLSVAPSGTYEVLDARGDNKFSANGYQLKLDANGKVVGNPDRTGHGESLSAGDYIQRFGGQAGLVLTAAGLGLEVLPFGVTNVVGGVLLGAGAGASALSAGFTVKGKLEGDKNISWGDVALSSLAVVPAARLGAVRAALSDGTGVARTALTTARFATGSVATGVAGYELSKAGYNLLQGKLPTASDLLLATSLAAGHAVGRNAQSQFDISRYAVIRRDEFNASSEYGPAAYAFSTQAAQDIRAGRITNAQQLWDAARGWRGNLAQSMQDPQAALFGRGRDPASGTDEAVTPIAGKYAYIAGEVANRFPDSATAYGGHLAFIRGQIDGKPVDLTTVVVAPDGKSGQIFHSSAANLPLIQSHVQELYAHALDPKTSRADALQTAARLHWWLVQGLPDPRGSAAKADVFTRSVLEARGIKVPPWKPGVVPDLEALTMNEDQFVQAYPGYFDRAP